jgi:hypothetical protein
LGLLCFEAEVLPAGWLGLERVDLRPMLMLILVMAVERPR